MAKTTSAAVKKAAARITTAKPSRPRQPDPVYVDALRRQVEIAKAAAATVEANRDSVGLLTAGVLKLCAAAYPDAIGARLIIETRDDDRAAEILLPVTPEMIQHADEVATVKATANDVDAAYRRMVASVREWLALEHPRLKSDRIDIAAYSDDGGGESLAGFHADAEDPYVAGDLRAIDPTA